MAFVNLPDTNVWIALTLSKHQFHSAARDWFATQRGAASMLFCRATQQSFLRLLTTTNLMRLYGLPPMTNVQAWDVYERLMADARITWAAEPDGIEERWKSLASRGAASPKIWMDAYLAAFAITGAHWLVTTDAAFKQFEQLNAVFLYKR